MIWTIEWDDAARRQLRTLPVNAQTRILKFTRERLAQHPNPGTLGKPLNGKLSDYVRFRVGDYRLICSLEQARLTILVLKVANRRDVYR